MLISCYINILMLQKVVCLNLKLHYSTAFIINFISPLESCQMLMTAYQ